MIHDRKRQLMIKINLRRHRITTSVVKLLAGQSAAGRVVGAWEPGNVRARLKAKADASCSCRCRRRNRGVRGVVFLFPAHCRA